MGSIRFGARIPSSGPASSRERLIDSTQRAEALGYDAVFVTDHVHNSFERHTQYPVAMGSRHDPSNTLEPHQFETVASFAYLAAATRRIELGVSVMPILLRDPIVLAKEVATLDALSGGRFIFGVGVSNASDREEFRALNRPFEPYATRYAMLGEYVAAMRAIWERPSATFHGRFVNFDDLVVYPKPARRIPVWVGSRDLSKGVDHPAVRFALDHADGCIGGLLSTPEVYAARLRGFERTAAEAGRDLSDFVSCFGLRLSIGETIDEARRNAEWILGDQADMARFAGYMRHEAQKEVRANIDTAVVGTPADVRARIRELVDAGANHFDLWFMYPAYDKLIRQMELFAQEVMPEFRAEPSAVRAGA